MNVVDSVKWWQRTVFYEIYIASFQDGNGDGIGDFLGLTQRLDYLQELGIGGVWITPFYPSPKVDNGYDVSDYCAIDPIYGDMSDFEHFVDLAHQRNIRVIIDLVLNHVSDQHDWFKGAVSGSDNQYRDYFIFRDKPNNWESFFGGAAWSKEPRGHQYYYHKFSPEQVDLNWQNPRVVKEALKVIQFWMDKGVDGFRFDVINYLTCDGVGSDNPFDDNGEQVHVYDIDQPGVQALIAEICRYIREHGTKHNKEYFLVGEVGHDDLVKLLPYQSSVQKEHQPLDVVFNFNLGSLPDFDLPEIVKQIKSMDEYEIRFPTLFFNSHDMPRSMSRLCGNSVKHAAALAALMMTARGVCFVYFGEEIGMQDYVPECVEDIRDVKAITHFSMGLIAGKERDQAFKDALTECRDKSRSTMAWDNGLNAGFSDCKPWINGERDSKTCVKTQRANLESLWHWYKTLIALRREYAALCLGGYEELSLNEYVLHFKRSWEGQIVGVLINFSEQKQKIHRDIVIEADSVIASRSFDLEQPDWLPPFAVVITFEDRTCQ